MRSVRQVVEDVRLEAVRGRVMDAQVWSETHVKGSGSAIMVKGIGAGSARTTSTVVNRREACIETEDGLQIVEAFDAGKVTLMPGQEVTLVRAIKDGMDEPVTVGVRNHSMRKSAETGKDMFPGTTLLTTLSLPISFFAIVMFVIALSPRDPNPFLVFLPLLALFGNAYWFRASAIRAAFKARVRNAMRQAEEPVGKGAAATVAA